MKLYCLRLKSASPTAGDAMMWFDRRDDADLFFRRMGEARVHCVVEHVDIPKTRAKMVDFLSAYAFVSRPLMFHEEDGE